MNETDPRIPSLIIELGSKVPDVANLATEKLFKMGIDSFKLLLMAEDIRKPFRGTMLANPKSSILIPSPRDGYVLPTKQKYKVVTVEVAAVYLLSAIYHDNLHFARAPQLVNTKSERSERVAENTPERVKLAYKSAREWVSNASAMINLIEIRKRMPPPFAEVNLGWN